MENVVSVVKESLEGRGWYDAFYDGLEFMKEYKDEDTIIKTARLLDTCSKFSEFYKKCRSAGFLSCTPQLTADGMSIVYGAEKYLHWFRGYYYQISSTPDGCGAEVTPAARMDHLIAATRALGYAYRDEAKAFVVALSMLTTAYCYYDKTVDALNSDSVIFDKLLSIHDSRLYAVMHYTHVFSSVYKYFTPDGTLLIRDQNGMGYATIYRDTVSMHLQICEGVRAYTDFVLVYPDWLVDIDVEALPMFYRAFAEYLLHVAGIRASYVVMYPIDTKHHPKTELSINTPRQATQFVDVLDYISAPAI